jgi:2'-5' RNA ligase
MMQALVSLLEPTASSRIQALWQRLEERCGLRGIKSTPYPHFSWEVVDEFKQDTIDEILEQITSKAKPFTIQTSGLGLFTGLEPVIYIVIAKDQSLLDFHKMIWEKTENFGRNVNMHYMPDAWIPHVTLAHSDVDRKALLCAMEELSFLSLNWEIEIDNLALVGQAGNDVGILIRRFDFKG